jgi:hypothetical protein
MSAREFATELFLSSTVLRARENAMKTPLRTIQRENSLQRPARPLSTSDLGAVSQILSSSSILPIQFYGSSAGLDTSRGEIALMRAVLEDAIGCFQKQTVNSGRRVKRLAREAEGWFFTTDYNWPFSFVNICAVLGLDPEYMRMGLKRWRQRPQDEPHKKRRRVGATRPPLKIAA